MGRGKSEGRFFISGSSDPSNHGIGIKCPTLSSARTEGAHPKDKTTSLFYPITERSENWIDQSEREDVMSTESMVEYLMLA